MKAFAGQLIVRRADSHFAEVGRASSNETVQGLVENTSYYLSFESKIDIHVVVDDVALLRTSKAEFIWKSDFFSGTVRVEVSTSRSIGTYFLQVEPASEKLGVSQLEEMVSEIRRFDEALLLGESAAQMLFGNHNGKMRWREWIRWQRIRDSGAEFVQLVEKIASNPHSAFSSKAQTVPLSKIRRVPLSALRDRRIVSLISGAQGITHNFDAIRLQTHAAELTLNTPANQTLCSLLYRFRYALGRTSRWLEARSCKDDSGRMKFRLSFVRELDSRVALLLKKALFSGLTSVITTSGGLTQIASNPLYARAYRKGTEALRVGATDGKNRSPLRVSPSWGIYETWCFVSLSYELAGILECSFSEVSSGLLNADIALQAELPDGRLLQLLFQAKFPSLGLDRACEAWSISGERIPDITVAVCDKGTWRFVILDAKYRSGKGNLLEGMESAHIYSDSLFVEGNRAEFSLILHPGESSIGSLDKEETWEKYGVGSVSRFALGGIGVQRCASKVALWVGGEPEVEP